ncbi:T9SS type A sorting domain-containing protein [Bacteroidota bacterium]
MKSFLQCFCFILLSQITVSQITFEKLYVWPNVNNVANSLCITYDNSYMVTGWKGDTMVTDSDLFLMKINAFGDTLWTKTYGGSSFDQGDYIIQTLDSCYAIVGGTSSITYGNYDVYFLKTDKYGDTLWTRHYGGVNSDFGRCVHQTSDSGFIIVGTTCISGSCDIYMIKTDQYGDTSWTKTIGGPAYEQGFSIRQTFDKGYIIAGLISSATQSYQVYLLKTDSAGNVLWSKEFGGPYVDNASSVQQTSDSGYIIAGRTKTANYGQSDAYLIKTDANGDSLWTRTYGDPNEHDEAYQIIQTFDGGYVFTGYTTNNWNDLYVVRTDSVGNTIWSQSFGDINYQVGSDIRQTYDSCFIIAGTYLDMDSMPVFILSYDIYIIKLNSSGILTNISFRESENLFIYPNPTQNHINLKLGPRCNSIEILNMQGQIVYTETIKDNYRHSKSIDLSQVNRGVYLIKVRSENSIMIGKVLKL